MNHMLMTLQQIESLHDSIMYRPVIQPMNLTNTPPQADEIPRVIPMTAMEISARMEQELTNMTTKIDW